MPEQSISVWWIPTASAVAAAASWTAFIVLVWQRRRADRLSVDREYAQIARPREIFWTEVRQAYDRFRATRTGLPDDLDALISASEMPPSLPRPTGNHLRTWAIENVRNLRPDQRTLWEFCSAVYPPRNGKTDSVTDHSLVPAASAANFHQARGDLARFWNAWVPAIGLPYMAKRFHSARLQVMILSWLECALVLWTQDDGEEKKDLFRLAVRLSPAV